jgi:hypothetical protein
VTGRNFSGILNLADENPTKQYKTIVNNFDHQRQHSGNTSIESIIVDAYYNHHFRPGGEWSFKTIKRDVRFKDNAKFCRCLELFVVTATGEKTTARRSKFGCNSTAKGSGRYCRRLNEKTIGIGG